jgi:tetratricopeptide (TPR) repeat protein
MQKQVEILVCILVCPFILNGPSDAKEVSCSDIPAIINTGKLIAEKQHVKYLSNDSRICFFKENATTEKPSSFSITPVVLTPDGRKLLLPTNLLDEDMKLDTLFSLDMDHNGRNELVLIFVSEGYLREYSSAGTIRVVYCFRDTSLNPHSCIGEKYPLVYEHFGAIRSVENGGVETCDGTICSLKEIIKEIWRLEGLPKAKYLLESYECAMTSFKYKMITDAANISTVGLMFPDLLSDSTVGIFNDFGYFKEQAKQYDQAIAILELVIQKYPNRTVAYLNLGDAFFGIGDLPQAKNTYAHYVELMKKENKHGRIPPRALERSK